MDNRETDIEDEFTTEEKILYSLLGLGVLTGGYFLGRTIVRQLIANHEEKMSLTEGSSATVAKQIKMAFENDGWMGTNVEELRRLLIGIPSKEELEKVSKSYNRLYSRNLMRDMSDELQSSEYNEMLQIIASKPERTGDQLMIPVSGWAKRLRAAFDKTYGFFSGTDEEAIRTVLMEIPTQAVYQQVIDSYFGLYGSSLPEDLRDELDYWDHSEFMDIIQSKPEQ